ncbi:ABC transporter ATP-binding protein [Geminicoccus flavidas]|uniref:ABC transporter ATP-binding protein n=1 Tax=Geminicoccus flavidas TaxID=2506407 RepID=UPI00210773CE|nr:sn-glycerol-3-phosphate ABC transporter ATP-binding protein UgpC [Geminicoccus flavidas]
MASVELRNVTKRFGAFTAVQGVDLSIRDRELVVFVGPSGCGKSTLLRMIAGLESISAGELLIGGRPANQVAAANRGIAMVFQSYALYPHMTVRENMGFALRMLGTDRGEIERRVRAAAATLQLEGLLDRRPKELSGGQRQRVAIGRAITREPDVFLFDEPLSNLDAGLRAQMRVEIARLHRQLDTTMIYVTHDQVEAMTLAERIVVLNGGRIEQQGAPLELYERPANRFVAGFLGQPRMNFVPLGGTGGQVAPWLELLAPPGRAATLGVRPDGFEIHAAPSAGTVPAEVVLVEQLGNVSLIHLRIDGLPDLLTVEQRDKSDLRSGDTVQLQPQPRRSHVFDNSGARIDWS